MLEVFLRPLLWAWRTAVRRFHGDLASLPSIACKQLAVVVGKKVFLGSPDLFAQVGVFCVQGPIS